MTPAFLQKLKSQLIKHESLKLFPYTDIVGNITIGVGRNLTGRGISNKEALFLLEDDVLYFYDKLNSLFPWFADLDENRKIALVDMSFMGLKSLLEFKHMLEAFKNKDYALAAMFALDSKWAKQVGNRAVEDANIIRTGNI